MIDHVEGDKYFSNIDLRVSYLQIQIAKNDIPKIAFHMHYEHYEFLVMPFGFTNGLATFQQETNVMF